MGEIEAAPKRETMPNPTIIARRLLSFELKIWSLEFGVGGWEVGRNQRRDDGSDKHGCKAHHHRPFSPGAFPVHEHYERDIH